MRKSATVAVAAALLVSGMSAGSAASRMSRPAGDTLTLTDAQHLTIWNDVSRQASSQEAPADFKAAAGATVPNDIKTYPLPRQATRDVPAAKPYRYAKLQDNILIVNPADNKIADVVSQQ